jgi:hypothetical protein
VKIAEKCGVATGIFRHGQDESESLVFDRKKELGRMCGLIID